MTARIDENEKKEMKSEKRCMNGGPARGISGGRSARVRVRPREMRVEEGKDGTEGTYHEVLERI
jgi:hypothetical protein